MIKYTHDGGTKLNDDEEIQDTKLGNHIQSINGELLCI